MSGSDEWQDLQRKVNTGDRTAWLGTLNTINGHIWFSPSVNIGSTKTQIISEPMVSVDDASTSIRDISCFVRVEGDAICMAKGVELRINE